MTNFFIKVFGTLFLLTPTISTPTDLEYRVSPPPAELHMENGNSSAEAVFILDLENNAEIYAEKAMEQKAMASLTKLMTALIILENHELDEIVIVPGGLGQVIGSKLWILENEQFTVADMLQALLIRSANDVAISLAIFDAGNVPQFVDKMNARANSLGLHDTHFQNPHGLDAEKHYSSARDLAFLTAFLLKEQNSFFRDTVATKKTTIESLNLGNKYPLETTNYLLGGNVHGVKTGTTDKAGECLITLIEEAGQEYLFVVLNSQKRFKDTKALIDEFLEALP